MYTGDDACAQSSVTVLMKVSSTKEQITKKSSLTVLNEIRGAKVHNDHFCYYHRVFETIDQAD